MPSRDGGALSAGMKRSTCASDVLVNESDVGLLVQAAGALASSCVWVVHRVLFYACGGAQRYGPMDV